MQGFVHIEQNLAFFVLCGDRLKEGISISPYKQQDFLTLKVVPDTNLGLKTMKKKVFIFTVMIAIATSVTVLANSHRDDGCAHNHGVWDTHMTTQGKHCTGSVGCSCSGFSPITNGEVWQQSYCKHCGHKKNCHK